MKILDCTLRDGGYYTNWDFEKKIVDTYLDSMNSLPIDYLEVGYRSPNIEGYQGEFFYCTEFSLKRIKEKTSKKLAILIDQKNIELNTIEELLKPCIEYIDLIRIAVKPNKVFQALRLAEKIKKMGFKVAFNVMYLSEWENYNEISLVLPKLDSLIDYFYMVDSYGSVLPGDVKNMIQKIKAYTNVPIGFHGHNNLELGLINTLTAIDNGVEIIDATITGMGRGAGNLKTELLLSVLDKTSSLNVDFDALSEVTNIFETLKEEYKWGTSLPYMVSGARSLPQKEVMEWVSKKVYSLNSVVRALNKQSNKEKDIIYNKFRPSKIYNKCIIIGGGPSVINHQTAIKELMKDDNELCLIHASSKNAYTFKDSKIDQYFCLVGNEGLRMSQVFKDLDGFSGSCILPPSPRKMGTFVPKEVEKNTFELNAVEFTKIIDDSHTAIAIQTAIELGVKEIYFTGFDGYLEGNIAKKDHELFLENTKLFNDFKKSKIRFTSITPTNYKTLTQDSVYKIIDSK